MNAITYASDRQRVERALVARLFSDWMRSAIHLTKQRHGRAQEGQIQTMTLLFETENEALDGAADRDKLEARVDRLAKLADRVTRGNKPNGKAPNLASVFVQHTIMLKAILDAGYMTVADGSRFDIAHTAMVKAIYGAGVDDLLEAVDKAATKRAKRVLKALQAEGLYPDVKFSTTEAEGTPA